VFIKQRFMDAIGNPEHGTGARSLRHTPG
jgi:hypothetical protein